MDVSLVNSLRDLSAIQAEAVNWDKGPLLVLAGPGSGKTRVLTCRAAQLLDQSSDERFRILALTFTNKAAHEMSSRVNALVPGLEERADIHTFHSFCAQVLRQHGAHIGIKSDFAIFSRKLDRQLVLEDAVRREGLHADTDVRRFLPMIDALKARLIGPEQVESVNFGTGEVTHTFRDHLEHAYRLYEDELRLNNALDFNSLIFETYKLFNFPVMVSHYQTVYRYWMIDEFQDTNGAQYKLLRRMAGDGFRNIFAVADDDQTIYEWNGANVQRIRTLVKDFGCKIFQLPTNFRCPPNIVEAANRLLVYNVRRDNSKIPTQPADDDCITNNQQIRLREFQTSEEEAFEITKEIAEISIAQRTKTLVLARTRVMLESIHSALVENDIPATILMRRDDFASPELRWLAAYLKMINRPQDLRNFKKLVEAFSEFTSVSFDVEDLLARSMTEGVTYFSIWLDEVQQTPLPSPVDKIVNLIANLALGNSKIKSATDKIIQYFEECNPSDNLHDDISAWRKIRTGVGSASLDRFLQELELSSKEPIPQQGAVSLATIHGAKGLEFDYVYLIGLAEEILPSWHSVKKGDGSAALEEERRGCFVAITRTKKQLVLSWARQYRGWPKQPSRFLTEMGFNVASCNAVSKARTASSQPIVITVDQ